MSTILVIAPHPDDESIGCGGTIRRHIERGDRVVVVFLTSGEMAFKHLSREEAWGVREREAMNAGNVLGVSEIHFLRQPDWFVADAVPAAAKALSPVLKHEAPRAIYLPHPLEWHPDHRASLPVVRTALREMPDLTLELLTYEVWTPLQEYEQVEDIGTAMARKLRAVRCYESQLKSFRYDRAVRGLNQYRGALAAHCRFAEVFGSAEIGSAEIALPHGATG